MDRPRTSHSHYEKRSISALWRPKTRHDTQSFARNHATSMPSKPSRTLDVMEEASNSKRVGTLDSLGQTSDPYLKNRAGPSGQHFESWPAVGESKTLGRQPSKRRKLSALFMPKQKESTGAQEERPHTARHSHTGSWLRRAKSATLRIGRGPIAEEGEAHEAYDQESVASDFQWTERSLHTTRPHGGAAARASAAAASRERSDFSRSPAIKELTKLKDLDLSADSESGIGIDLKDMAEDVAEASSSVLPRIDPASLAPEIFEHVISYLDAQSVMNAELVSKRWLETASSYRIWRGIFGTDFVRRGSISSQLPSNVGGLGLGTEAKQQEWKQMWKTRKALNARWNDGHAAAIYLEGHKDSVYCVQFDEDKIITGSRDRTIRVWDARTYHCIKVLGVPKTSAANHNSTPLGARMNRQRPFESMTPPKPQVELQAVSRPINHTGSILCLQFDKATMITGSSDHTVIVWDIASDYKPTNRLEHHTAGVLDVCFNQNHIVSCSKDTSMCLWDRSSGNLLRVFNGHRGPVNAVQLRGVHIVSASGDGVAKLWNITSGNCVKEFPSRDRGLACVEFSPDSRTILAGGNDQVIYQFDANTGELVRELNGHTGLVRSLHLDSVNGRVISGSYDYSVKAFDVETGEKLCDFLGWTTSWMLSAKADYRRIVATSQDARAVVMDFGHGLKGVELLESGAL